MLSALRGLLCFSRLDEGDDTDYGTFDSRDRSRRKMQEIAWLLVFSSCTDGRDRSHRHILLDSCRGVKVQYVQEMLYKTHLLYNISCTYQILLWVWLKELSELPIDVRITYPSDED